MRGNGEHLKNREVELVNARYAILAGELTKVSIDTVAIEFLLVRSKVRIF